MINQHARSGFTIVELLVLIAVISLLAALIFGALGPARERSRQTACISNLHQFGNAFRMYISDYDGIDPVVGEQIPHASLGLPPTASIGAFIKMYKLEQVQFCPSDHRFNPRSKRYAGAIGPSYAFPGFLSEDDDPEFLETVARLGGDFTLMYCVQHNDRVDPPTLIDPSEQQTFIQLRLDGAVNVRRYRYPFEWQVP